MSNTEQHIESNHSSFKDIMPLSFGEEVGNTVTHGFASFCTMVILPYAAVHSFNKHGALLSTSISIFVISLFLMFISSTVYHAMANHTVQKYYRP